MAKKNSVVERVANRFGFVPVTKLELVATEAATKAADQARSVMLAEIPAIEQKAASVAVRQFAQRRYAAAQQSRLTSNFLSNSNSADAEIRQDLRLLRERMRQLERDNDHVRKWLQLLGTNVLGSSGIGLQMKVTESKKKKGEAGNYVGYDDVANDIIETAWYEFNKAKNFTVTGKLTGDAADQLILRSVARDGGFLIQHVRGSAAGNKFGYAVHLIEIDQLAQDYNLPLQNGVQVKAGVEMNEFGKPLRYFLRESHPGDEYGRSTKLRAIPAADIINPFVTERAGQTSGVPWGVSAMLSIKQLDDYERAELVAATVSANKMGFFETATGESWDGECDGLGNKEMVSEPGVFEELPQGMTFKPFDPQHPTTAFAQFQSAVVRRLAAGLGVSYVSLSGDLSAVNFSSIRAGLLDEREVYKMVQKWFIDTIKTPIFEEWLSCALLSSALQFPGGAALPASKIDKFNQPDWKPRRWQWVDPKSDVEASLTAINGGLTSRRKVIAEGGGDVEDVFQEIEADNELADERGITFQTPSGQVVDSSGQDVNKQVAADPIPEKE